MYFLMVYVLYLAFSEQGLTNANHAVELDITTSDQCIDGSYRMVHNRNFSLHCFYNHSAANLTTVAFKRGTGQIITIPGALSVDFADRASLIIWDNVAVVEITANLNGNNSDISNYSCAVGVDTFIRTSSADIDPTYKNIASVSELAIMNLITEVEDEIIFSQPYITSVIGILGTGDYDCQPPVLSVEDENGHVYTSSVSGNTSICQFEVNGLTNGTVKLYTVTASLYGVSVNKMFSITYIELTSTTSSQGVTEKLTLECDLDVKLGLLIGIPLVLIIIIVCFLVYKFCFEKEEGLTCCRVTIRVVVAFLIVCTVIIGLTIFTVQCTPNGEQGLTDGVIGGVVAAAVITFIIIVVLPIMCIACVPTKKKDKKEKKQTPSSVGASKVTNTNEDVERHKSNEKEKDKHNSPRIEQATNQKHPPSNTETASDQNKSLHSPEGGTLEVNNTNEEIESPKKSKKKKSKRRKSKGEALKGDEQDL